MSKRYIDLMSKRCIACGEVKPIDCFHRHKGMRDGLLNKCKPCVCAYVSKWAAAHRDQLNAGQRISSKTPERRATRKAYEDRNKEHLRAKRVVDNRRSRLRAFGLDEDSLVAMFDSQMGLCQICERQLDANMLGDTPRIRNNVTTPCVDHDHATGAIRGILCGHCNRMLGMAGDQPAVLREAAAYLERAATI